MRNTTVENRVGPYRILRAIREGGQGRVYLGYDDRLQRRVAIKIYSMPTDRAGRRAVLREARLIAAIENPRVVQVHDVITSSGHLAMVMEYIAGTDLEQVLRVGRLSLASVLSIATDLAGALAATRQQQLIHGDLKASNILIAASGRAKLSDFGIAQKHTPGALQTAGSHAALSPEHVRGEVLDTRSDLFSLGCLLYRMISGEHPFFRHGRLDTDMLVGEPPPPLDVALPDGRQLPDGLGEMVMHLLEKDPRDRPANTHKVREVLRRVSRQVPLSAGNPVQIDAAPYFRPEFVEDPPLSVPRELGVEGRSRLAKPLLRWRWSWRNRAERPWFVLVATGVAAIVLMSVLLIDRSGIMQPVRVHIDRPEFAIASAAAIPETLSIEWLVDEFKQALGDHLGPMLVTGPVGATPRTTLYTRGRSPADQPASERFSVDLRCGEQICLLGLSRERDRRRFTGSAMLFPDQQPLEWRLAVERAVRDLFLQPGAELR